MEKSTAILASQIGQRVKQERQSRAWTLDRLATVAGVSRRMIVSVEQGAVNPSVGTLLRISDALGLGLPALVTTPQRAPVKVMRAGEGALLWQSKSGGRGVLVAGTESPDVLELWDWILQPGDVQASEPHAPGTKELLHVHEGTAVIEVDGESISLEAGDALSFPGDVGHSYSNPHPRAVRFSLAVFEPDVGTGMETSHA